ncbi:hypothetical protein LguiB_005405 [Lonicera macranthoides]
MFCLKCLPSDVWSVKISSISTGIGVQGKTVLPFRQHISYDSCWNIFAPQNGQIVGGCSRNAFFVRIAR